MNATDAIKILKGIDGRVIFDKGKHFFSKERTWEEARDSVPLDSETTPKRYDIVGEGIAHAEQVLHRQRTGKATLYIDTPTEDLEAGLKRAVAYLESIGAAPRKEDESWKAKSARNPKKKEPSASGAE